MTKAETALRDILDRAGRPLAGDDRVTITGADPVLPTNFLIGAAASAALAAIGLAASDLWRSRTGRAQTVAIDHRAAAIHMRGDRYLSVDGKPPTDPWSPIAGFYEAGDGRWIQLHTNFPHHRDGVLKVLGCADDRDAVAAAIRGWEGQALEDALAEAGMCAGMIRSAEEWAAHPQGQAIADLPSMEIVKIGDSAPEPLPEGAMPAAGLRVLDFSRVLAGPVCGRTLAEFGADVLRVAAPHLPFIEAAVIDTGHGKRSCHLDLREGADRQRLTELVRDADVFSQAYRPGAMAGHGFGPEALAEIRPGIVCVSLCAYSHAGPWRSRRGFDSLSQSVSGIAHEGGDGKAPKHLPAQALDYVSGYLAAFGAMVALARRAEQGGSWLVRLSLAQTGHWLKGLGRLDGGVDGRETHDPTVDDVRDLMMESASPFGTLRHVRPVVGLSETPPRYALPAVPLGTHEPVWAA